MSKKLILAALATTTMLVALPTAAGTASAVEAVEMNQSPQQKLMAKRAAELDAYRLIAERVLGLEISAESTVRDFVGLSDRIATRLDTFIKGVRFTNVRHFSDGSCEVDAEITIQQVVKEIKKIYDEIYEGGKWHKEELEHITKRTHHKVISVTGSGAARAESRVQNPATTPIIGPIVGTTRSQMIDLPAIYGEYAPGERLKAKRAAELDAYRKLLERVYGLQIDAGTRVRDFVTESDDIRARTEGELKGVRFTNIRYAPDGVVELEGSITIQQVIRTIQKVYDEVYEGGEWKREDFEKITKKTISKTITVLGVGALDTSGSSGHERTGAIESEVVDEVIVID